MGRAAAGMIQMGSPLPHRGGTSGSRSCLPHIGTHSAFQLPSPDHRVPASACHKATSAYHFPNKNRQNAWTTTQAQVITQDKMTLSLQQNLHAFSLTPSSVYCCIVGREGEEAIKLTVAVGIFLGLGAVHNFLAYSKENNMHKSAPAGLNMESLSGSNLSLHP